MTRDTNPDDVSQRRRRLLQAVGAGAAATAFGATGVVGAQDTTDGDAIDPNLGFAALTDETVLPAEPDHEVQLLINPPTDPSTPIPEFYYQPTGLAVEVGDVVAFRFVTPGHTVSSYHPYAGRQQRIPDREDGLAWFSSPYLGAGATWLYRFDRPGVYDYYCGPHELFGHVGRIVVGGATQTPPVPDPCPPPMSAAEGGADDAGAGDGEGDGGEGGEGGGPELRPPAATAALVLRDPALAPENIVAAGAVGWEEIAQENKQLFVEFVVPEVCALPTDGSGGSGGEETTATAYQVDFVVGEPDETLGEDPQDFYDRRGQLLRFLHGSTETPVVRTGAKSAHDVADCVTSSGIAVEDGSATVRFTVGEDCEETLSLVSYVNPAGAGVFDRSVEQRIFDASTETFGPGDYELTVALPTDDADDTDEE